MENDEEKWYFIYETNTKWCSLYGTDLRWIDSVLDDSNNVIIDENISVEMCKMIYDHFVCNLTKYEYDEIKFLYTVFKIAHGR